MKIRFLGTGTSQGIPLLACTCPVCRSQNPKDHRLRTSALIEHKGDYLLIDPGPDLRQQLLRLTSLPQLSGILITHEHGDHTAGLDDLRPYNVINPSLSLYAEDRVCQDLQQRFGYIFGDTPYKGGPKLSLKTVIVQQAFTLGNFEILPLRIFHGGLPILAYKIGPLVYITDAKQIPQSSFESILESEVLVLNALRKSVHPTHLSLDEAIEFAEKTKIKKVYLTHLSHQMGLHDEASTLLPGNIKIAYDGLEVEI